jgi:hypothetical protein
MIEHMFDVMGDVETAVAKLLASEEHVDVARLAAVRAQLDGAWLRAVDEFVQSDEWRAEGFVNAASALRAKCRMTQASAHADVSLARKLRDLPVTAEALGAGEISRQHAAVIADAATAERAIAIAELESAFVAAARVVTARELRPIVDRVTDALDGDDGAARANAQHLRRRLHVSRTLGGMVALDGVFDPESGEILLGALESMKSFETGDARTPAQKRADALVDLVRAGAAHGEGPGRAVVPAEVSIHIDLADIERRGGTELVTEVRAHRGALPRATLRRLTCDARISRVITDGRSEVLDVGRATRTIPPAVWRALVARDGGCSHPSCDRPPQWCDAHHIVHWADGGATSLENLELRCRRHHRMVHEGGLDPP